MLDLVYNLVSHLDYGMLSYVYEQALGTLYSINSSMAWEIQRRTTLNNGEAFMDAESVSEMYELLDMAEGNLPSMVQDA